MTWKHRLDADALPVQWPLLVDRAPLMEEFVLRDATIEIGLQHVDRQALRKLAMRFGVSDAGLILQAVFVFVYGRYLLVRMRRNRSGLFEAFAGHDPARNATGSGEDRRIQLAIPSRLLVDLDALARRRSITPAALAEMALARFINGHLDPDSRIQIPEQP